MPGLTTPSPAPSAPFVLFWHRLGNTPAGVDAVHAARRGGPSTLAGRPLQHGVELDLKWARDGAGLLLYAHHGPTGRERLAATTARRRAARGDVALVDALLDRPDAGALAYLVELKRGAGPAGPALAALDAALTRRGLRERVWLAASSLLLLEAAAAHAPALPRVLFAAPPRPDGRLAHRPTTHIRESLRRHGLLARPAPGVVDLVSTLGVVARAPAVHAARAARCQAHGLGYLPGRVTRLADLEALAAQGAVGAFAYAEPALLASRHCPPSGRAG